MEIQASKPVRLQRVSQAAIKTETIKEEDLPKTAKRKPPPARKPPDAQQQQQQTRTLTVESLRRIVCCLCFETKADVGRVSAFGAFADQTFLSDIVRTCFGVDIDEEQFCTDVCEQCLVRIEITWQFYRKVNANANALKDLYRSINNNVEPSTTRRVQHTQESSKHKKEFSIRNINVPKLTKPKSPTKIAVKRPSSNTGQNKNNHFIKEPPIIDQESSDYSNEESDEDSESDGLSEHPFFAEHTKSVYNCHLCPQTFDKSQTLHVHQLNAHQTDNDKILCHLCPKWFSHRHFQDHVRNTHMEEKVICTICGQSYTSTNLQRHMRIHTKERPYACKLCTYTCNQSTSLKQHVQRIHMGDHTNKRTRIAKGPRKPKQPKNICTICDAAFHHALSLERHIARIHMGIKPPPRSPPPEGTPIKKRASRLHPCPVCEQKFFRQSKLITHLEETHPDHQATFIQCEDCPERFLHKRGYNNHRMYRHSEKTYKCDHCGEDQPSAPIFYNHKMRCYQRDLPAAGSSQG